MNQNRLFWTTSISATVFFGLLTLLSFSEWWTVAIKQNVSSFQWGSSNDSPWYYENPVLYSKVMLTEGLIMLIGTAASIWFLTTKQKTKAFYSLLLCFGLFLFNLISGFFQ